MKKSLRFIFPLTVLAGLAGLVFFAWKKSAPQPAAPVASLAETVTPVVKNTPPKIDALVAKAEPQPQMADAFPRPFRLGAQPNGAVRFLGVQPGWRLPAGDSLVADDPAETARRFLLTNRDAFGLANPRVELTVFQTQPNPGFTTVRLQQTYGKLPVLAAETVVQVSDAGDIRCVLADLATHIPNLDRLPLPLVPTITEAQAPARAVALVRGEMKRGIARAEAAKLVVYVPEVLSLPGEPALAWEVPVASPGEPARVRGRVILHAGNGTLLNFLDENYAATDRRIFDDGNSATTEPNLVPPNDNPVRVEGGAATGIAEVDNLYAFIGQTDTFYQTNHGRNGYDGNGGRILAIARSVPTGQAAPWVNADSNNSNLMRFGLGFVTDDIVAHEYTHLVTNQTSRLIYQNASGALNESFSDIWAEFTDLLSGTNDTAAVRWLLGEDLSTGATRSMRDPGRDLPLPPAARIFDDPDRLSSAAYIPVAIIPNGGAGGNDNGGVHTNSGVCNKLCYLLTDGDTFNSETVTGEGIGNVADLFYEVQTNLLVPAADWRDFYFAINQAATNLGWSLSRRINVEVACNAVEISTAAHDYYIDSSSPAVTSVPPPQPIQEVGIPNVVGTLGPYRSIPAGFAAVDDRGTVNINGAAGTYFMGGTVTFTKPMTIKTYNAPTTIEP